MWVLTILSLTEWKKLEKALEMPINFDTNQFREDTLLVRPEKKDLVTVEYNSKALFVDLDHHEPSSLQSMLEQQSHSHCNSRN